ncbi:MAG TPA: FixH family protein [Kofleriaceae bacterium]
MVPVAQTASTDGTYNFTLLAPAAIPRGNYELEYVVTTAVDGAPVDGLDLDLVPWMPAMGHGTSIVPSITGLGSGVYALDDVDLFMAGLWELRTTSGGAQVVAPSLQVQ